MALVRISTGWVAPVGEPMTQAIWDRVITVKILRRRMMLYARDGTVLHGPFLPGTEVLARWEYDEHEFF